MDGDDFPARKDQFLRKESGRVPEIRSNEHQGTEGVHTLSGFLNDTVILLSSINRLFDNLSKWILK